MLSGRQSLQLGVGYLAGGFIDERCSWPRPEPDGGRIGITDDMLCREDEAPVTVLDQSSSADLGVSFNGDAHAVA
jgi:hypothetical protein